MHKRNITDKKYSKTTVFEKVLLTVQQKGSSGKKEGQSVK